MRRVLGDSRYGLRPVWVIAVCLGGLMFASPVSAQFGNVGGVSIDSQGMLRDIRTLSEDERLKLLQQEAVVGPDSDDLANATPLRKVSLRRWEEQVRQLHKKGKALPADVRHLAGLTAIRYLVFDPERQDVILAGPAEGWTQLSTGEVVGKQSRRPVLHADDLIAALRSAFDRNNPDAFIGCSIDPTQEGVKRYAAYMNRLKQIDRSRIKQIFAGMEKAMGPQRVRLFGVEPSSRFALAMLAADYRLKRIALGHDPSPVKGVTNYLDLKAKRFKRGPQKQQQWWFQAKYDALRETPDHLAFELVGQGVEVVTAAAIPGQTEAEAKPTADPSATEFAESFTKHFSEIAEKQPVFAELQNLIGLAVVSELIAEKHREPENAEHWKPGHLLAAEACPLREYHVPKQVPSIANYRLIRNRHWLISLSGGVNISAEELIGRENRQVEPHRPLNQLQEQTRVPEEEKTWWWD